MIFSLAPSNGCITWCVTFPMSANFLHPCLLKIFQCQCPKPCFLPFHPLDVAQPLFLIYLLLVQDASGVPSSTLLGHRPPLPPGGGGGGLCNHSASRAAYISSSLQNCVWASSRRKLFQTLASWHIPYFPSRPSVRMWSLPRSPCPLRAGPHSSFSVTEA